MSERVVVGWDGTRAAEAALAWALRHEPRGPRVELLVADGRRARAAAVASAEAAAERVRHDRPWSQVDVVVAQGPAVEALRTRSAPDALLVLGGADPGRGRHRSSTAYRVAATATGPVAMVPEGFDHGRDVVLGVGADAPSPDVALAAAGQAALRGHRLVAVHAWRGFLDLETMVDPDPRHDAAVAAQRGAVLSAALEPVAARYPTLPLVRKVLHGRPVDAVLEASRSASLLVLGRDAAATGRRARPVAHVALLSSRVPVLVVPREAA